MKFKVFFIFLLILLSGRTLTAQECSDAGVCTSGVMGVDGNETVPERFLFNAGWHFGQGDDGTSVNTIMLEARITVLKSGFVQVKLPWHSIDGNLGKTSGVGDLTLTFGALLFQREDHRFEGFAGARIGTGETDLEEDGNPLPMVYQTGLGTTDLLAGVKWSFRGWSASLGVQQPVAQNNSNGFLYEAWEGNETALNYHESNKIERKGDLVLRAEKTFSFERTSFSLGLVPIYHLQNDTFENMNGEQIEIEGSQGLTLNISASARYLISQPFHAGLFFGSPVITRDEQPAGLARKYVAGLTLGFGI